MQAVQPQHGQPFTRLLSIKAKTLIVSDASVSIPQSTFEVLSRRAIASTVSRQDDAFQLIASMLHQHPSITGVHMFTQCQDGDIRIGQHVLDSRTIERYSWDLQGWFSSHQSHLSRKCPKIHIHLNSSETAALDPSVIDMLTQLTGAEVIVSD